jgi:hypothetical protein
MRQRRCRSLIGTNSDEGAAFSPPKATPASYEQQVRAAYGAKADAILAANPHGTDAAAVVAWLDWQLRNDQRAAKTFVGKDCGLCTDPAWAVEKKKIG